ncbi:MAG: hypothetical protein H0V76_11880 [Blastocatellia bacterium]|nr:hypothetical protein [Blastocatellia bacterium]
MTKFSRRQFLSSLGVAVGGFALARSGFPAYGGERAFEFLVIGDSLVWGQGLREDQKFYTATKAWLRDDVLGGHPVNMNVHAHSGASIMLSEEEAKAFVRAEIAKDLQFYPEINLSSPSIKTQVDVAHAGYSDPTAVGLVLLSGGVPEVGTSNIINPFRDNDSLRADIEKYCYGHMKQLLERTAVAFPNATLALVGYYPIITRHTPMKRIVNDVLAVYNWPRWTRPLVNNRAKRIVWRRYRGRMIERSRIWYEDSTNYLNKAVDDVNATLGADRIVFVPTGFGEENGYGAEKTFLWHVGKGGAAADPMRSVRVEECRPTLDELRRRTELKYRTRVCELASIGHPNIEGSAEIAASIRRTLRPVLERKVSNL